MKPDTEILEFLSGVIAVCEATRCERQYLWQEWHERVEWIDASLGHGRTVGTLADMPVHISLLVDIINGQKTLFWHATSQVVDHRMIEDWLIKALPVSAFRGSDPRNGMNRTDASNFCYIVPDKKIAA